MYRKYGGSEQGSLGTMISACPQTPELLYGHNSLESLPSEDLDL